MAPERGRLLLLTIVLIVLAGVVYELWPQTAASSRAASNRRGDGRAAPGTAAITAPDVHLDALAAERPKPGSVDRNLFRFKPKAQPAPPRQPPPEQQTPVISGPPGPPPLAPIPLKFIGIVERSAGGAKIAVLSDARGVYHGNEGDTILGQYKILRIGVESIEMSYLDGRGRQTIRLSGS
jgi:hypothetical protein